MALLEAASLQPPPPAHTAPSLGACALTSLSLVRALRWHLAPAWMLRNDLSVWRSFAELGLGGPFPR